MSPLAGCWQVFGLTSAPAFAGSLLPIASRASEAQCAVWVSFSITAAGQPRKFAGFPFQPPAVTGSTNTRHYLLWSGAEVNPWVVPPVAPAACVVGSTG